MSAEYVGHTQPAVLCDTNGTAISATNPLPVTTTAAGVSTLTDRSGTIAAGATAQTAAAANTSRDYLLIQNTDATEDLYFNFGTTAVATQPSIKLTPNSSWENPSHFCPTGLVSVIAATTGHAYVVKEG